MKTYYGRVVQHKHRKFCFVLERDKPQGWFSGLDWYGEVRASSLKVAVSKLVETYLKERALTDDGTSSPVVQDGAASEPTPVTFSKGFDTGVKGPVSVREAIQKLAVYSTPDTPRKKPGRPLGYRKCAKCKGMHLPGKCGLDPWA